MTSAPSPAAPGATRPRRGPVASVLLSALVTAFEALFLALALGGLGPLLGHPRAPALVAIWALAGVILALVRPQRPREAAETRREPPLGLIALGLVPLITAPLAALGERFAMGPLPGGEPLRWAGVAVSAAGLALRIAAMAQLGPRFSPFLAVQREHALETRGLYGRVRHPGYAGSWLAALGAALTFGSALGLAPVAVLAALLAARTRREEIFMEARFGEAWRAYRAKTGAFLPRLG